MKKLTCLTFAFIFSFLAIEIATADHTAQHVDGIEYTVYPSRAAYGGPGGLQNDEFMNNGVFKFKFQVPVGYDQAHSFDFAVERLEPGEKNGYGELVHNFNTNFAKIDTSNRCQKGSEFYVCEYLWDARKHSMSLTSHDATYNTWWQVENPDFNELPADIINIWNTKNDTHKLSFRLDGPLAGPIAVFENSDTDVVTDTSVSSYPITILADLETDVSKIELDLRGKKVVLTESETVSSDKFGSTSAKKFTYDWDISNLSEGVKKISATAFDSSGETNHVFSRENNTFISLKMDVSVERRLIEQCEADKQSVASLIDTINLDLYEQYDFLTETSAEISKFVQNNQLQSDLLTDAQNQLNEQAAELNKAKDFLEINSNVDCSISLSGHVDSYREAYEDYLSIIQDYRQALLDYAKSVLQEVSDE